MASTVWKGYISFGLISVPVRMFVAAREQHVSFHQVHQVCGTRIKQQLFCPTCERVVERSELAKGYPLDKETNILISNEELKALDAASSQTMDILQFVKLSEVDPIYYQTSYFTVAEDPGRRAYALMMQGMQRMQLGAIAKLTLHQREQVVIIRPYEHGLILHTLYYPAEVRELPEFGSQAPLELQEQEIKLAEQFMKQLEAPFHPQDFKDEYESRVEALVESKQAGTALPAEQPKRQLAPVINLMDALKKSIAQRELAAEPAAEKKQPARAAASRRKRAS